MSLRNPIKAMKSKGVRVASAVLAAGLMAGTAGVASSATAGASASGKTVELVSCFDVNAWCTVYNHTIVNYLTNHGVHVTYLQDPFNASTQVQNLTTAIDAHPNLILLLASASDSALVPGQNEAKAAGIPLIYLNSHSMAQRDVVSNINAGQCSLGQFGADNIISGLKAEHKAVKGNVVAITGSAGVYTSSDRMACFNKELAKKGPGLNLVSVQDGNWDPTQSGQEYTAMVSQFGKTGIVGGIGMADYQTVGMIQAAQAAGQKVGVANKGVVFSGTNCTSSGMAAIANGTMWGDATQMPAYEGNLVAVNALKYLNGGHLPRYINGVEHDITARNYLQYKAGCSQTTANAAGTFTH
jgi:ABC-type sugar transport system substrate-binding protein